MGPKFKALGPKALLPMIELVAMDAPPRGAMSDSAWTALRAGLIEASDRDAAELAYFAERTPAPPPPDAAPSRYRGGPEDTLGIFSNV